MKSNGSRYSPEFKMQLAAWRAVGLGVEVRRPERARAPGGAYVLEEKGLNRQLYVERWEAEAFT